MSALRALPALGLLATGSAQACVGCRQPGDLTVAAEQATVLAGNGFSISVVFLLGMMILVAGSLTWLIWSTCRRLEREGRA